MKTTNLFTGIYKGMTMAKSGKDVNHLFLVFLFFAMIFCNGEPLCAAGVKAGDEHKFVSLCLSDGLLLFNELVSEAGKDYVQARKVHSELFRICIEAHKADYVRGKLSRPLLEGYESVYEALRTPVPKGVNDPNAWAKVEIKKASKNLGDLILSFAPHLEKPFEPEVPQKLDEKCEASLRAALNQVKVELREYIRLLLAKADNSVILSQAEDVCEANRRAILLAFIFRFADFENRSDMSQVADKQVGVKMLQKFQGDINRTIHWNGVIRERLKESDPNSASRLLQYSNSELRRLKVIQAISDKDMSEAQSLLLIAFKDSYPLTTP